MTFDANVPDVVGGVALAAVGAGFTYGGYGYGLWTSEGLLGPGAMPFLAGTLLLVFGAATAITALRPRLATPAPPRGVAPGDTTPTGAEAEGDAGGATGITRTERSEDDSGDSLARVFSLVALAAAAITAITWFDTYITLGVLVVAILTLFERVSVGKALAVAAGVMGTSYLIFSVLLNVPLPSVF